MTEFWNAIPLPTRSALNVAFAALVVWVVTDGVDLLNSADLPAWVKGLLVAVVVPAVRALNPADAAYGLGSGTKDITDADLGDH